MGLATESEDVIHNVFHSFVSTSVIGGKCSSVWDCGDLVASWLSRTLSNKDTGLRLVYHHSTVSMRTHSPKVHNLRDLRYIYQNNFSTWDPLETQ